MNKVLYFDVETTGLDPVKQDIIQIAGLIEIDNVVVEEFEFKVAPVNPENATPEALDVHGYDLVTIMQFPPHSHVYNSLIELFSKYIDKYNKADKFTPAGYNVRFDMDFLKNFFLKHNDKYFGSWFNYKMVDPLPVLHYAEWAQKISLENYKLVTVCERFGIELQAHDALSDIRATREVLLHLSNLFED